jgi:hypothetical protein
VNVCSAEDMVVGQHKIELDVHVRTLAQHPRRIRVLVRNSKFGKLLAEHGDIEEFEMSWLVRSLSHLHPRVVASLLLALITGVI